MYIIHGWGAISGWLTRLQQAGTEVHVRSVFLQGLLLMEADKTAYNFQPLETVVGLVALLAERPEAKHGLPLVTAEIPAITSFSFDAPNAVAY